MQFPTGCLAHLPEHGTWKTTSVGRDLANATWCIDNGAQTYFVKRYGHDEMFGRAPGETVRLDRELATLSLAPQVVWSSVADGICVFEWMNAATIADEFDPHRRAQLLGQTLATIHQAEPSGPRWSLRARVQHYCDALIKLHPRRGREAQSDCDSYADLFRRWDEEPHVFCHHDLNAEHVFLGNEPRVIDWEYAGYGHPGFDLASTIVVNDLYDDEISELLASYQEHSGRTIDRESVRDWLRLVALVNRIWFHLQEAIAEHEALKQAEEGEDAQAHARTSRETLSVSR